MGAVSRARDVCAAERTLDTAPIFHRMSLESEGKKTLKADRGHRCSPLLAPIARSPLLAPIARSPLLAPIACSPLLASVASLSLLASVASLSLLAPIARHEPHASK